VIEVHLGGAINLIQAVGPHFQGRGYGRIVLVGSIYGKVGAKGEAAFREEPFVRDLIARFDGQVNTDTIVPLARDPESK
jgi:NAD(P)-dependent dehydrogenase (short-subunit alcohol dehydrogenase family)